MTLKSPLDNKWEGPPAEPLLSSVLGAGGEYEEGT